MVDRRNGSSVGRFGPLRTRANSRKPAGRQLSGISGGLRVRGPVIRDFRIAGDKDLSAGRVDVKAIFNCRPRH
jgi:hypothetical protein